MRVQYRCIKARMEFEPEYREYCSLGLQNCTGCQVAELRRITVTTEQMIEDDIHAEVYYDYTTGRTEKRGTGWTSNGLW